MPDLDGVASAFRVIFGLDIAMRTKALSALTESILFAPLPSFLARVEPSVLAYRLMKEETVKRGILVLYEIAVSLYSLSFSVKIRSFSRSVR